MGNMGGLGDPTTAKTGDKRVTNMSATTCAKVRGHRRCRKSNDHERIRRRGKRCFHDSFPYAGFPRIVSTYSFPARSGRVFPGVSTGRARITLEPRFADADLAVEAQIQGPDPANGEREVSMTRQMSYEPLLCTLIELPLVWLREAVLQNSLLASSLEIFSQFHREGRALCL